jgi:type II secretory pathway pseudopilin PulG
MCATHQVRCGRRAAVDEGTSLVELLAALTVISIVTSLAVPATAGVIDRAEVRHAAAFVAAALRSAREDAIRSHRTTALVFDATGGRWTFRVCVDDNGNGVRRADLSSGDDHCGDVPIDLGMRFPHVEVVVDNALKGPDDSPPSADPVRFGASDMASFSPAGSATPGTLFLRSAAGEQYAVRVGNMTGRTRVLRFDEGTGQWQPE